MIWKYKLEFVDVQVVSMPRRAKILSVQWQRDDFAAGGGNICLWAVVDPDAPYKGRIIKIYGTGTPGPGVTERHLGTVVVGDYYVWHIFEAAGNQQQSERKNENEL